ncbi:shikimate kinase [Paenibacillus sp. GCM10012307]|uniref:shikimate kinase n=1 Tax=Paenibacillus TaxID=44249 RepID=UPI001E32E510|nr:shikimate kinase [Paenibacillus roseus]
MSRTNETIVLVGFMGTGKSSVSRLLARQLQLPCIDLDAEIERQQGRTIRELFADFGEEAFREVEGQVLSQVLESDGGKIIATGGGAVLREQNRKAMLQHGWVIALTADAEKIVDRVKNDTSRPLLQGNVEQRVTALLEERRHAYDFVHHTVDTTRLTSEEVAAQILGMKEQRQ